MKYNKKHGLWRSQIYGVWCSMKSRCFNPRHKDYRYYGGRGVTVCDRWTISVINFVNDMGPKPGRGYSLDRINNDGNYEPSNCRWATKREQTINRRKAA